MIDKSPDELIEEGLRLISQKESNTSRMVNGSLFETRRNLSPDELTANATTACFYVLLAIYKTLNQKTNISYNTLGYERLEDGQDYCNA